MAEPLSEFGAARAWLSPAAPPSAQSVGTSLTPHAMSLLAVDERATVGSHDRVEVRYTAASGVAALLEENSQLVHELRASRLRIVQAAERERRRLEQNLHDGAQQRLIEIQVRVFSARALVDRPDLAKMLEAIQQAADAALDELRTLARGIHPATLRDLGPAAALRAIASHSVLPIHVNDEGIGRLPAAIEEAIYFCAREAIQNSTKHAGPGAEVTVTLRRRHNSIQLTIRDNGVGLSPKDASSGIGILGMRDRIEAVGGQLKIVSHPGQGASIHTTIHHQATERSEPPGERTTQVRRDRAPRANS
jgi:signal transduction histidine kinase